MGSAHPARSVLPGVGIRCWYKERGYPSVVVDSGSVSTIMAALAAIPMQSSVNIATVAPKNASMFTFIPSKDVRSVLLQLH